MKGNVVGMMVIRHAYAVRLHESRDETASRSRRFDLMGIAREEGRYAW